MRVHVYVYLYLCVLLSMLSLHKKKSENKEMQGKIAQLVDTFQVSNISIIILCTL